MTDKDKNLFQTILERIIPLAARSGADLHASDDERLQKTRLSRGQPMS
jgi:hypothetical protein